MLLVTGCDFMRALAGRPVSSDLQRRAFLIELEKETLEARRQDELRKETARLRTADSLALCDSIRRSGFNVYSADRLGGIAPGTYGYKYTVVVGAFSTESNASRFAAAYKKEKGYDAVLIPTVKGLNKVGICQTNDIFEFWESLSELRRKGYSRNDASVLIDEDAL